MRRIPGTFELLTRANLAAARWSLAGGVLALAGWMAEVHLVAALTAGAVVAVVGAAVGERRRGRPGHPAGVALLVAGWALLTWPIGALAVSLIAG